MKYLKLFENFEEPDLHGYCEEFWDIDPEFLFELIQYELEDNSLKKMRFLFENMDKRNITLIVSDKNKLSMCDLSSIRFSEYSFKKEYWINFFKEIKRFDKEKNYPIFPKIGKEMWESENKTSVYFQDDTNTYFPEIQLGFDKSSIIEDGNIGDWEDHFNSIFKKVGIPYLFDGDNGYFENDMVWYTLYHT